MGSSCVKMANMSIIVRIMHSGQVQNLHLRAYAEIQQVLALLQGQARQKLRAEVIGHHSEHSNV